MKRRSRITPIWFVLSFFIISLIPLAFAEWGFSHTVTTPVTSSGDIYIDNPKYGFPTLEAALKAANEDENANNIYIKPGSLSPDLDMANTKSYYLKEDASIDANDTLILNYTYDENNNPIYDNGSNYGGYKEFANRLQDCVTSLYIDPNVTLTINGSLIVGGYYGTVTNPLVGQTSSLFTEIILGSNTSIIVENGGTLESYGYIRRNSNEDDTPRLIVNNGANCIIPLVIYDYKGGQVTTSMVGSNVFPFSLYDFPNLEIRTIYKYGANLTAKFKVTIQGDYINTVNIIGMGNEALFSLGDEASYLEFSYVPEVWGTPNNLSVNDITSIDVYGDLLLGSVSVTLESSTVDSAQYYMPITYKLDIRFHSGSVITVPNDIKLLPGNKVVVEEGVDLFLEGDMAIFPGIDVSGTTTDKYCYPFANFPEGATFINNGTLHVGENSNILGFIDTTVEGAQVLIDSKYVGDISAAIKIKEFTYITATDIIIGTIYSPNYVERNSIIATGNFNNSGTVQVSNFTNNYYTSYALGDEYYWDLSTAITDIVVDNQVTAICTETSKTITISDVITQPEGAECSLTYSVTKDGVEYSNYTVSGNSITIDFGGQNNTNNDITYKVSITASLLDSPSTTRTEIVTVTHQSPSISMTVSTTSISVAYNKSTASFNATISVTPSNAPYSVDLNVGSTGITYTPSQNGNVFTFNLTLPSKSNSEEKTYNISVIATHGTSNKTVSQSITITHEDNGGCLLPDTEILLANGQVKLAKDIAKQDKVLAFNHLTGEFVARNIIFTAYVAEEEHEVVTLTFDNGNVLEVAEGHGFFNVNKNNYEIYYGDEFYSVIGNYFLSIEDNQLTPTKLIDVKIENRITELYTPLSEYDINVIANGMLSIPDVIEGMLDSFKYNEDYTYDLVSLNQDIETYGVYSYSDVNTVVHEYVFDVFGFKYWKLFIKKGTLTYDKVNSWIEIYMEQIVATNNLDWDISKQVPLGPVHG